MTTRLVPPLIGIGGLLQHGKDTVADYLVDKHGWVKMGMSDPLNEALLTLDPWIRVDTYISHPILRMVEYEPGHYRYSEIFARIGYVRAKEIPDVRLYLQRLGTEVGRNMIDENVWVNVAEKRIEQFSADGQPAILTGIRYPNELEMIRRQGGELWWVQRKSLITKGEAAQHTSENSVGPRQFDRIIHNDGTLEQLYESVDRKLAEL